MIPIGTALDAAVALYKRFKPLILAAPLLIALAVQTARIEGFLWIDGYKDKITARDNALAAIEVAIKANAAAQIAQNKAWEAKSTDSARSADNAYNEGLADGRNRAAAYADSHRVRWQTPARSSPASEASESPVAPSDNQAGPGPDMVAIPRSDFDILTENTLRLQAVHAWGVDLRAKGLAEPLPDPAFPDKE